MSSPKPNILWICSDQQRRDTLGCYGNPHVHTPNLDRLASLGVRFDRAYTQSPVCAPSRACFLTGRYPRTCNVRQNGQDIGADEVLVPRLFRDAGYACGLSGKLHLSACHPKTGRSSEPRIDDGYDAFFWSHHPQAMGQNGNMAANEYTLWLADQGVEYQTPRRTDCRFVEEGMPVALHQSAWCTDKALSFMKAARRQGKPWLFSINYFDPHHPFDPPRDLLERYLERLEDIPLPDYVPGELQSKPDFQTTDHNGAYATKGLYPYEEMSERDHRMIRAAYWAMCDLLDIQVGRLLAYLQESGELENTVVVYMSDHGEHLGDHGMYLKGPCFYECSVRVPLIVAWPGTIAPGRVNPALVELCDLPQTLLDAAGLPSHPGMMGQSLWPMLAGQAPLVSHRSSVYCEFYNANVNHVAPKAFGTMVCDGRWKLARYSDRDGALSVCGELYDLAADPGEHENRYQDPAFAQPRQRMLELLCDRMVQTCDPLPLRRAFW